MTTTELINEVEYITDATGQRKAVVIDLSVWEAIIAYLEDIEDAAELRRARLEDDEVISWEQVKATYLATHSEA